MVLVAAACVAGCVCGTVPSEPVLSDYPELFLNNTIIVTGTNASYSENSMAEDFSEHLQEVSGNESLVKTDTEVTELEKASCNLILIGVTDSNSLLNELYNSSVVAIITEEYPGDRKCLLQIIASPWAPDKLVLIIASSTPLSALLGIKLIDDVDIRAIQENTLIVDDFITVMGHISSIGSYPDIFIVLRTNVSVYRLTGDRKEIEKLFNEFQYHTVEIKGYLSGFGLNVSDCKLIDLGITLDEFSIINEAAIDYFSGLYPGVELDIIYSRMPEMEDREGLIVLEARPALSTSMYPVPQAIFEIYEGNVSLISGSSHGSD